MLSELLNLKLDVLLAIGQDRQNGWTFSRTPSDSAILVDLPLCHAPKREYLCLTSCIETGKA